MYVMKRLILAGIVTLGAFTAVGVTAPKVDAAPNNCDAVRCVACPEGQELKRVPNDCCRCVPIH
jgi:hypothetical protein